MSQVYIPKFVCLPVLINNVEEDIIFNLDTIKQITVQTDNTSELVVIIDGVVTRYEIGRAHV